MLKRCKQVSRRVFCGTSRGATLVEVTIAIVVLAFLVGAVLGTMVVVFNMQTHQDQQRIAEYLTRNQFEYTKTQIYSPGNITGNGRPEYALVPFTQTLTQSYFLDVTAIPIYPGNYTEVPLIEGPTAIVDEGMQKIVISVYSDIRSSTPVLVTTNYKVFR